LVRPLVGPSVGPHITSKTDYVAIASRRGEGKGNRLMLKTGYVEIALRLVTIARSCWVFCVVFVLFPSSFLVSLLPARAESCPILTPRVTTRTPAKYGLGHYLQRLTCISVATGLISNRSMSIFALQHATLQCLSAQVIVKKGVHYKGSLPPKLESFVDLH
jgi:hypothetical protein